jgi:photosystem II stability/assembly factor-like uncharacterized protein
VLEAFAALVLAVGPTPPYVTPSVAWGDARHAWAAGSGGILASVNAGASWRLAFRGDASGIDAVDATHAWGVGASGTTVRTTDGLHWRSLGVQHLLRLSFVDRSNGFALERDDFLMRTRDGGASWARVTAPQRLQSLCFSDAHTGWVARAGTVWTTRDGGSRWRARTLAASRQGFPIPDLYCRGRDVWVVLHEGAAAGTEGYRVLPRSTADRAGARSSARSRAGCRR